MRGATYDMDGASNSMEGALRHCIKALGHFIGTASQYEASRKLQGQKRVVPINRYKEESKVAQLFEAHASKTGVLWCFLGNK